MKVYNCCKVLALHMKCCNIIRIAYDKLKMYIVNPKVTIKKLNFYKKSTERQNESHSIGKTYNENTNQRKVEIGILI